MRQQSLDLAGWMRGQPRQHIFEISVRIMPVEARRIDQAHDRCHPLTAAQLGHKLALGQHPLMQFSTMEARVRPPQDRARLA